MKNAGHKDNREDKKFSDKMIVREILNERKVGLEKCRIYLLESHLLTSEKFTKLVMP